MQHGPDKLKVYCKCGKWVENQDTGLCATCSKLARKEKKNKKVYRLNPISKKRAKQNRIYLDKRIKFLQNKRCSVFQHLKSTEIHHMMGRVGYADDYARQNNISLLNDERYWLPVSRAGHEKIEINPEWAKLKGFSISRI